MVLPTSCCVDLVVSFLLGVLVVAGGLGPSQFAMLARRLGWGSGHPGLYVGPPGYCNSSTCHGISRPLASFSQSPGPDHRHGSADDQLSRHVAD
eukprot:2783397-Pyramimonas_sp.AAC.1